MDRAAEIAAEHVGEEHAVLHGQGLVEPELTAHAEDLASRRVGRYQERHGVSGEPHDDEDHRRDEPDRDQGPEEPRSEEEEDAAHRVRRLGTSLPGPRASRALGATESEVEAPDLELLVRGRRPLYVR